MANQTKIEGVKALIESLAREGFTGSIELKFHMGGISGVRKFEEISCFCKENKEIGALSA